MRQTLCAGGCMQLLDLGKARACAILICKRCRKDPLKFRDARSRMTEQLKERLVEERKTNPFYPFDNFSQAWENA